MAASLQDRISADALEQLTDWCNQGDAKPAPPSVLELLTGERLSSSDVSALMQLVEPDTAAGDPIERALASVLGESRKRRAMAVTNDSAANGTSGRPKEPPCQGMRRAITAQDPAYASGPAISVPALLADQGCLAAVVSAAKGPSGTPAEKAGVMLEHVREALRGRAFLTVAGAPRDDVRIAVREPTTSGTAVKYMRLAPTPVGPSTVFIALVPRGVAVAIWHARRADGPNGSAQETDYLPSIYQLLAEDWSDSAEPPAACVRLRVALEDSDTVLLDGHVIVPPGPAGPDSGEGPSDRQLALRRYADPGRHRLLVVNEHRSPVNVPHGNGKKQSTTIKFESELEFRAAPECVDLILDVRDLRRSIIKVVASPSCERKGLIIEQVRRFAVDTLRAYSKEAPKRRRAEPGVGRAGNPARGPGHHLTQRREAFSHVMDFEAWAQSVAGIKELRAEMGSQPDLAIGGDRGLLDVHELLGSGTAELWRQGFARAYIIRLSCSDRGPGTSVVVHEVKLDALAQAGRDKLVGSSAPFAAVKTKHENTHLRRAPQAVRALLSSFCGTPHMRVRAPFAAPLFPTPNVMIETQAELDSIELRAERVSDNDARCQRLDEFEQSRLKLEYPSLKLTKQKSNTDIPLNVRTPGTYLLRSYAPNLRHSAPICIRVRDHRNWLLMWLGWMRTWDDRDVARAARDSLITVMTGFTVETRHTSWSTVGVGMLVGYGAHSKGLKRPPAWDGLTAAQEFTAQGDLPLSWVRHGVMFGPVLEPSVRARANAFRKFSAYTRLAILGDLGFIPADQVPPSLAAFRTGHTGSGTIVDFDVDILSALGLRWRMSPSIEFAAAMTFGVTALDDVISFAIKNAGRRGTILYDFAAALGFAIEVSLGL